MKQEHSLMVIVGLFLLSYLLDAVVNPLATPLATPYQFFSGGLALQYPFTTASIVIKGLGIFLTPPLIFSLFAGHNTPKGAALLIIIALMQLYALQDIATKAHVVPLEWALSISLAGIALTIPMIYYFIRGGLDSIYGKLSDSDIHEDSEEF